MTRTERQSVEQRKLASAALLDACRRLVGHVTTTATPTIFPPEPMPIVFDALIGRLNDIPWKDQQ